ncbi:MAG: hypothetical protein HQL38_08855 [Alphaproteobacteria bacterium]|nr:hypothetical protein [Alphaproteobacteria bacterium]
MAVVAADDAGEAQHLAARGTDTFEFVGAASSPGGVIEAHPAAPGEREAWMLQARRAIAEGFEPSVEDYARRRYLVFLVPLRGED